ncbi:MAG: peptidase domain-containing ABC transporter [bacterium]
MENTCSVLHNLPIFALLPQDVKEVVLNSFVPVPYSFGKAIVQEGEPADAFYVLASGRARVIKTDINGNEISLYLLRPGDTFGEMGLLSQTEKKRTATVRASSDVLAYRLDSSIFQALLQTNPEIREYFELQIKYRNLHNFFLEYTPFCRLPISALKTMLSEAKEISLNAEEMVIMQGDDPGPMYIIEDGRLRVFTEENGQRTYRAYLRKGDFFGELSMLKGIERSASVQALTSCRLLMLRRESFQMMIDNYPEFIAQIEDKISEYDYRRIPTAPLDFNEVLFRDEVKDTDDTSNEDEEQDEEYSGTSLSARLGPFASTEGHFVKKSKRRIRSFPYVWQGDESDCGAASLAMVCRFFGHYVSLSHIRQLVYTGIEGASLNALCGAARQLGLEARSIKTSKRNLAQMPLPAIVHWQEDHWVVLYDVEKKFVSIADPAVGLKRISLDEFEKKWTGYAALFDYTQRPENLPEGKSFLHWLWPFFRPFKSMMVKIFGLTFALAVLQMSLPVFIQKIVDWMFVGKDTGLLTVFALSMMAVLFLMFFIVAVQRYLLSFAAVHMDISAMDLLTRKILDLPMDYFNRRHRLDLRQRIEGLRPLLDTLFRDGFGILSGVFQLSLSIIIMFFYSPLLGLLFLLTAPIYAVMIRFFSRKLKLSFDILEEFFRKYHSNQLNIIKGIETIKVIGAEGVFRKKIFNKFQNISQPLVKTNYNIMCFDGLIQIVTFFSMAFFVWIGAYQVINGRLSVGGLVAFSLLVVLANEAFSILLSVWRDMQSVTGLSDRLIDIFEQEPEQGSDHSQLLPVRTLEGKIRFQHVGFRYGGPDSSLILEDISFEIPSGKKVAIVGRNGSGKTTLIKCLSGLLEPTEGTILYDHVDLKTINHKNLRRHFALVLQENHIFDGTIAGNIALGEKEPDMDQVLWASRLSNAHMFIEKLPLGYDTKVGDTGIMLSASQIQRIAIARAIYQRPSIFIFDNATAFLDKDSERLLWKNMHGLLKGHTSFIVDNQLERIRDADIIIVIEKGKLAEQGTHDELMRLQGIYYYLYHAESKLSDPKPKKKIKEETACASYALQK